jgi:hypothetical protein
MATAAAVLMVVGSAHARPASARAARPDLAVTALSVSPPTAPAGATVEVRTTVVNRGAAKARRSKVKLVLSDIVISGGRDVPSLRVHQRSRSTTPAEVPSAPGTYALEACADAGHRIEEAREANNCRTARLRITEPVGPTGPTGVPAPYPIDGLVPAVPVLSSTAPASPSPNAAPDILGIAEPGSTVELYAGLDCSGRTVTSGTADASGAFRIGVTVDTNSTTSFHATSTDAAKNTSACTVGGVSYTHDDVAPEMPTLTGTTPASPADDARPTLTGTGPEGATIRVYTTDCEGPPVTTGRASEGTYAIAVDVAANSTTRLTASAVDAAGNASACPPPLEYRHDDRRPAAPVIQSTNPGSPAQDQAPDVTGTAEPAGTVRVFAGDCDGEAVAKAPATEAGEWTAPGVPVAAEATTTLRASVTDAAGNESTCSGPFAYTHQAPALPAPVLSALQDPPTSNLPHVRGTAAGAPVSVTLFRSSTCGGPPVGSGPPPQLNGLKGLVPTSPQRNGASVAYTARSEDAGGHQSACSNAVSHLESRASTLEAEIEPNGLEDAQVSTLKLGEDHLLSAQLGGGDSEDDFDVQSIDRRLVRFELFSDSAGTECAATGDFGLVYRFDPFVQTVSSGDGIGACASLTTVTDPARGSEWLRVTRSGAGTDAYTVEMRSLREAGEESEPNNGAGAATAFPSGNDNYLAGELTQPESASGDEDWYSFSIPPGPFRSVRIEAAPRPDRASPCTGAGVQVELRNAAGDAVMGADVSTGYTTAGPGASHCGLIDGSGPSPAHPGAHLLAPGSYRIRVAGAERGFLGYALVLTVR